MADNINTLQTEEELALSSENQRYLTFSCDNLTFAVNTDTVIEIITNFMIRKIPLVPGYIMGIINVRGQIIPIIDMRLRIGKESATFDTSCIIILEIDSNLVGIAVDAVLQVLDLDVKRASAVPVENQNELASSMLSLSNGSVVLLLNLASVIQP